MADCCGFHAIALNADRTLTGQGGQKPRSIADFSLSLRGWRSAPLPPPPVFCGGSHFSRDFGGLGFDFESLSPAVFEPVLDIV
jgi:hypothetical protein